MKLIVIRFRYEMMCNEAHALFGKYPAEETGVKALADRYALLFAKEKAALNTIVKSAITDELEAVGCRKTGHGAEIVRQHQRPPARPGNHRHSRPAYGIAGG